ncbi:hypothetical protein [Haloparvum sp. AD34]
MEIRRRKILVSMPVIFSSGCISRIAPKGVDYTLNLLPPSSRTQPKKESEGVVRFDEMDLTSKQQTIVEEAIENRYSEGYVNWHDVPDRETISDEYKNLIKKISNELDMKEPPIEGDRTIERRSKYDEWYLMRLTVEKAPAIDV